MVQETFEKVKHHRAGELTRFAGKLDESQRVVDGYPGKAAVQIWCTFWSPALRS
jgi:hypothetical protein